MQQTAVLGARPASRMGSLRNALREMWLDKAGLVSVAILVMILFMAVLGPVLWSQSATQPSLGDRLIGPFWTDGGSWEHPLGTDGLGRDMVARLFEGARASLFIAVAVVLFAAVTGVLAGMLAGYKGGMWDTAIMRAVDTQVAFPGLLLALVVLSILGASMTTIIVVLGLNGWMVYARVTRSVVLSLKKTAYVQAAETVGCKTSRIMRRHLLPNLVSPLLTLGTLEFARIILAEASLSYLGLGIQPPGASWGLMVAEGQTYLSVAWWVITLPGIAITLTVLALNLFASWLRVVSDPQQREKRFITPTVGASG